MAFLAVAAAAVQAFGQYKAGQDQKSLAQYNESVAQQNAEAISQKTAFDVQTQKDKARRLMSIQRVNYAKSGVEISEGTPLDVLLQQVKDAELETLSTQYTGKVAYNKAMSQGDSYGWQGERAAEAATIGAVGTIMKAPVEYENAQMMGKLRGKYGYGSTTLQER
jgi:hypothetical protein